MFHSLCLGTLGQQQLISVCWRVFSGRVAAETGTGEVWAGTSTQWLGRPGVPQVHTDVFMLSASSAEEYQNCWGLKVRLKDVSHVLCCCSSDITDEDLEEAGVLDPTHKRILLESLRQQQEQQPKWTVWNWLMTGPSQPGATPGPKQAKFQLAELSWNVPIDPRLCLLREIALD